MNIKKSYKITFGLLSAMLLYTNNVTAQNGINSPYSRYGFGIQSDRSTSFNKSMSGVAQGYRDGQIINAQNPASYSAVDSMTALFDFGLTLQNGNYKMGKLQKNARNSSIDYAALHFRAAKNVGVAFGILPYTNIGYSFTTTQENITGNENNVTTSYTFTGDGGLHQVFLGTGWRPIKQLSFGFNASYLYGEYTHTMTNSFSDASFSSLIRGYNANISTYMLDFGLQYIQPLSAKDKITLGFTYGLGHDVDNTAKRYTETFNNTTSSIEAISGDTLRNAFQLPHSYTVGVVFNHGDKWSVGADFQLEKWSKCRLPYQNDQSDEYTSKTGSFNDKMRVAVGGSYSPVGSSLAAVHSGAKLFKRSTYKFGAYYSRLYANPSPNSNLNSKPTEYGLSAGITMPIHNDNLWNRSPKIHIGVQWAHTDIPYMSNNSNQPTKQTLKENYLRLNIGLTVSDRWFYKWKVK